nr:cytosine permease [Paraburkholderia sp. LEh10]
MATNPYNLATLGIESHSIDYIPESERHGKLRSQGPFWFLGSFHFFTISIGFVGPSMGLSAAWTALAGTLGIMLGTIFMAFHGSQGPEMGLPQMIQSRAQFGYRGVLYFLVPWTAVNLVDYFFVRKGRYAIPHFFTPDGIYGRWQARGIAAYIAGFVSMIPFFNIVDTVADKDIFVGYFARLLNGIDIAWLVGLIVSGTVYFVLSRSLDLRAEERVISSIKEL